MKIASNTHLEQTLVLVHFPKLLHCLRNDKLWEITKLTFLTKKLIIESVSIRVLPTFVLEY